MRGQGEHAHCLVDAQPPHLCSAADMLSTVTDVKGVASPSLPMHAATWGRATESWCHSACASIMHTDGGMGAANLHTNLAHQRLHEVANGHAGGDGMRVDDEVGRNALHAERHVLLQVPTPTHP